MTTAPASQMKRWSISQVNAAICKIFSEQQEDLDFAFYEESNAMLYRANFETTPELIALEKQYQQFGLVKIECRDLEKFPVSGVFTQGIEGYTIYHGSLYRLLNIARLMTQSTGVLRCALFVANGGQI